MYQNRVFKRPFDERLKALFGTGFDALVWWPIALIELGSRFLCLLKGEQTSVRSPLFFVGTLLSPSHEGDVSASEQGVREQSRSKQPLLLLVIFQFDLASKAGCTDSRVLPPAGPLARRPPWIRGTREENVVLNPKITLRRATLSDRRQIFEWMAQSEATPEMLGPPTFPDCPVPTWEEFDDDFSVEEFFQPGPPDDPDQDWGECWIIRVTGEDGQTHEVGQINFSDERNDDDPRSAGLAELDIWIGERKWWGGGIGSQAIELLAQKLKGYGFTTLLIRPSARNQRATAAYKRAGFGEQSNEAGDLPDWVYDPEDWDYADSLVLVRKV